MVWFMERKKKKKTRYVLQPKNGMCPLTTPIISSKSNRQLDIVPLESFITFCERIVSSTRRQANITNQPTTA